MSDLSCRRVAASAALTLVFTSCGHNPASPMRPDIVGLSLTAPTEIAPGASSQLSAQAHRSDGSVADVTQQAEWSVDVVPAAALTVTTGGYVSAREIGRATVRARYSGQSAEAAVFVVPPGTFRVAGFVAACGISGLSNATVSVISGQRAGLATETDLKGRFELYGLAGPVTLRAAKDGFVVATREVQVTAHVELTFAMNDVSGGGAGCWDY